MLIEKSRYTSKPAENLEKIIEEINKGKGTYTKGQKELLRTIINLTLRKKLSKEDIEKLNKKMRKEDEEEMLAVLDMIEEENRRLVARGEKKGAKNQKQAIIKNMLKEKFSMDIIEKITDSTKEEIEKVKNKM